MQALLIALTIALVGLKLAGVLYISWLWVLSPLWIPFVLFGVFTAIILTAAIILKLI